MSTGSILIGLAITFITITYVARPFRRTQLDADRIIEQWVQTFDPALPAPTIGFSPACPTADAASINFCHHCGRKIQADHRFCPGCGTPLHAGEEA